MLIDFGTPDWTKRFGLHAVRLLISAIYDTGEFPNALGGLFHYTDSAGAHGIICSGQVRASHIYYMNDESEYLHAVVLLEKAIAEYPTCYGEIPPVLLNALRNNLAGARSAETALPVFVISFSSKKNDLSQWRAYGGGEGGISLGFAFNDISAAGPLVPCIYDPALQYQIVGHALIQLVADWQHLFANQPEAIQFNNADAFVFAILRQYALIAAALKNQDFREEAEWRLVFLEQDINKITISPKSSLLSGYITPPLSKTPPQLPLREVWIGPGRHQRLSQAAMGVLLKQHNYNQVPLFASSIPYRVLSRT